MDRIARGPQVAGIRQPQAGSIRQANQLLETGTPAVRWPMVVARSRSDSAAAKSSAGPEDPKLTSTVAGVEMASPPAVASSGV